MRRLPNIASVSMLALIILAPVPLLRSAPATGSSSEDNPALSNQQRLGEFVFIKNCALCHLRDADRPANAPIVGKEAAGVFGPELRGMFKDPSVREEDIRKTIAGGFPKLMPGFRYTLDAQEVDDLIVFLKAPFPAAASAGK